MIVEEEIVKWYHIHKRNLPWRQTKNPYEIWISEIMLQQTRVDQAIGYYRSFLKTFPNVRSLAIAKQQDVLKLWQGLGYYSRARNLHESAKYIEGEMQGEFPDSYAGLLKLKGIGEYTAAAIASMAFNEKVAAVDGNVFRVLSRIFAIKTPVNSSSGKKQFKELASELIKSQEPHVFNQAMMEFGALQCLPKNPDCISCPVETVCMARIQGNVSDYPVKKKIEKIKKRYFNYFYFEDHQFTYIRKRDGKDIWQGLYEFPLIETHTLKGFADINESDEWFNLFGKDIHEYISESCIINHQLTHQKIEAVFYNIRYNQKFHKTLINNGYIRINMKDLDKYPVSKLIENFINSKL